ncbi:YbaB/EbfC family nucleoid-associated protein [Congregibacter sp.]|jgi:DNA-binding YbaB/EbfC family protein|uniref:YbaB/EbfC family nucleoid-associated protein n=1 Tax=Congregibacter sp. TaxID=2744308 RepID=UPI0039E4FDE7
MKSGLGDIMQQAQKMQADMQKAQEAMAEREVVGESGAGMVSVTMTGRHDVRRVHIDPSVLSEDKAVLEDLLAAAVNDAVRRVEEINREAMQDLTGGLSLPSGFKFPF